MALFFNPAPNQSEDTLKSLPYMANSFGLVGKVTDANNNRIPIITISFKGQKHTIKTDNTGLFRIQMLGSDSSTHIRIGSTGYSSVDLPAYALADGAANGGAANTIHLQSRNRGSTDANMTMGFADSKKTNRNNDLSGNLS